MAHVWVKHAFVFVTVGAHPCGRWFAGSSQGRVPRPIAHGVGSYKNPSLPVLSPARRLQACHQSRAAPSSPAPGWRLGRES